MMLDSGSSISLIEESVAASFSTEANTTPSSLKLVSAAGDNFAHTVGNPTSQSLLGDCPLFD